MTKRRYLSNIFRLYCWSCTNHESRITLMMLSSVDQLLKDRGSGGTLSSLEVMPTRVRFEAQDPQEHIVLLLRPHWITNFWWNALLVVLVFVPALFSLIPVISALPAGYLLIMTFLWYAMLAAFAFEEFLMWFFSVNIVTDERVIDVDFYGLLFKHVSVAQLSKIQDINYTQKGILASVFNVGNVTVQTAGEIQTIEFQNIPNPDRVVKILSELAAQEEQETLEGRVR